MAREKKTQTTEDHMENKLMNLRETFLILNIIVNLVKYCNVI